MSYQGDCYDLLQELLNAIKEDSTKEELAEQFDRQLNSLNLPTIGDYQLDDVGKLFEAIQKLVLKDGTRKVTFVSEDWKEIIEDYYPEVAKRNNCTISLIMLEDMYDNCTLALGASYPIHEEDELRKIIEEIIEEERDND